MAFYSLSEAEQHIMDYMLAHADQEEIHLNEIMEYMETKGYVWKQQTAYSFVIRLKNKKILCSLNTGFCWWRLMGSNHRPSRCQRDALTN